MKGSKGGARGNRARCTKGKSCGATCIDPRERCVLELGPLVSPSLSKVTNILESRKSGSAGGTLAPVATPVQPAGQVVAKSTAPLNSAQAERAAMMKRLDDEDREKAAFKVRQAGYDKAQEVAASKLTTRDTDAIRDYTSMSGGSGMRGFKKLNRCLRSPEACSDKAGADKFGKELAAALRKLPKNKSGDPFYRGVTSAELYKQLENAQPGTVMKDPGYGSYSADRRQTKSFMLVGAKGANILFVSRNKNLTPVNKFSKVEIEAEAIMPSNQQQTIRSVRKDGETLIVELD